MAHDKLDPDNAPPPDEGLRRTPLLAAVALLAAAFAVLPVWDGLERYSMLSAMSGAFSSGSAGAPVMPIGVFAYPAAAVLLAYAIVRRLPRSPGVAWLLFAIGSAVALLYTGTTAVKTALTRSHAIDSWMVCETQRYPGGGIGYVSRYKRPRAFDGPHLDSGDPCTLQAEDRLGHARAHPSGDLIDGIQQIWKRFPKDRARVLGGTVFVVAAVASGAALLGRARRKSRTEQVERGQNQPEREQNQGAGDLNRGGDPPLQPPSQD